MGDIIGWRKGLGSAIVLGQVMRRIPVRPGYALKFTRVRGRGRGWMLAGFEILPAKREEPIVAELPELSFVLEPKRPVMDDDEIAASWERDLSPRLLAS